MSDQVINKQKLNNGLYCTTPSVSKCHFQPEGVELTGEIYGTGILVGITCGLMTVLNCDLKAALKVVKNSDHFTDININCIPEVWHELFVIEDGRVVDVVS